MECCICGGGASTVWRVREMMRGTGDVFDYDECGRCGCLQIRRVPADLARYYGTRYYSTSRQHRVVRFIKERRLGYLATGRGLVGRLAERRYPRERDERVAPHGVPREARILEVGCGNGYYLTRLFELGFRHLWGLDPFMDVSAARPAPVRLERRSLLDVDPDEGPVDAVLFSHSLEHIAEQHETLDRANRLLADGGVCIVRTPTVSSWSWRHYGPDWVQLDAPRHLLVHSRASFALLAQKHGFAVERIVDDSTALQFWASEQYRSGIPLLDPRSWAVSPRRSTFTPAQMAGFDARATELNREGQGDQFAAYLRKVSG